MAELTAAQKTAAEGHIDNDEPLPKELEAALRDQPFRRVLTRDEKAAAKAWINEPTAKMPYDVERYLFGTSASVELEKLKSLADYTKFHLGVYMTLLAAIIAFLTSELGPPLGSGASLFFLFTVLCLALAGACGGMIGSHLPNHYSLTRFEETPLEKAGVSATGRQWIQGEHFFFWLGMTVMLIGLTFFTYQRWIMPRHEEIEKILVELSEAMNGAQYPTAARLWLEQGELHSGQEHILGRDAIQRRLAENRRGVLSPVHISERVIRLTDSNHAVVSGRATFNVSRAGQVVPDSDRFVATLIKRKAGWAIQTWSWSRPDVPGSGW